MAKSQVPRNLRIMGYSYPLTQVIPRLGGASLVNVSAIFLTSAAARGPSASFARSITILTLVPTGCYRPFAPTAAGIM